MNEKFLVRFSLFFICIFTVNSVVALTFADLTNIIPKCTLGKSAVPRIRSDIILDHPEILRHDFNGDGLCDYAITLSVPINSKMPHFTMSEILFFQSKGGWISAFSEKISYDKGLSYFDIWPFYNASLEGISLVYPKQKGAPFVLGVNTKIDNEGKHRVGSDFCYQYTSVHRWDAENNSLKRVLNDDRDIVLNYFYTYIKKPCLTNGNGADGITERDKPR